MFITTKELPNFDLAKGIKAKMIHTNQLSVAHVTVKAGSALPEHHHPHEQITNIIAGEFEMTVDGNTKVCKAGDVIIASNKPHSGRALTDCQIIDVFNPPREDYQQ